MCSGSSRHPAVSRDNGCAPWYRRSVDGAASAVAVEADSGVAVPVASAVAVEADSGVAVPVASAVAVEADSGVAVPVASAVAVEADSGHSKSLEI